MSSNNNISPWTKLFNLLKLERRDILQVLYYAVFAGIISLTLPLGIQAIINLIQGAQVSTSWILLTVLVTLAVGFFGVLQLLQLDIVENIQEKIFARASFEFIYKFPKIRVSELENRFPPELSNRFFDVLTLQKGMEKLLLDSGSGNSNRIWFDLTFCLSSVFYWFRDCLSDFTLYFLQNKFRKSGEHKYYGVESQIPNGFLDTTSGCQFQNF